MAGPGVEHEQPPEDNAEASASAGSMGPQQALHRRRIPVLTCPALEGDEPILDHRPARSASEPIIERYAEAALLSLKRRLRKQPRAERPERQLPMSAIEKCRAWQPSYPLDQPDIQKW